MIMKDALQNGKIDSNPTYEVDGPYVGRSTSYVFTPEECWAIYEEFPKRYRLISMFGFACGTRQAEAFGVCEDVIDWDRCLLTVRRQVLRIKETDYKCLLVDRLKTSPRLDSKVVPAPPVPPGGPGGAPGAIPGSTHGDRAVGTQAEDQRVQARSSTRLLLDSAQQPAEPQHLQR
ncbi:hypothetical protein PV367_24720 [Streptomyces europaeiscabiei]|uniref:Integrase n=1 Tax=Streptomyces europaeiscabiei TaxID=146819 RepID=A0AAJ2PSI8_9ACTN|nr:hypothetical protein [Streptomyces europaeiscabiei]MDX3132903.1 hypothetical protein [Streptomyces europaeiscabiei]